MGSRLVSNSWAPERSEEAKGEIVPFDVPTEKLGSRVTVIGMKKKPKEKSIEMADVLVVAGRGVKKKEDLSLLRELADALGGELACTRPLVEAGWLDAKHQIGLSDKTFGKLLWIPSFRGIGYQLQGAGGHQHAH